MHKIWFYSEKWYQNLLCHNRPISQATCMHYWLRGCIS